MGSSPFKSDLARQRVLADYDAALSHWPRGYESGYLPTASGRTHYLACGEAGSAQPPWLLLHGGGGNATMWWEQIESWARHRRVIALDIRGDMGRSEGARPKDRAEYVAWLDHVVNLLGASQVDLCGASFGGWLAGCYALERPHRVGRLTVVAPPHLAKLKLGFIGRAVLTTLLPSAARVRRFYAALASPSAPAPPPWALEHFVRRFQAQRSAIAAPPPFSDEEWAALPEGTLILVGKDEPLMDPVPAVARIQRVAPHVKVEWVDAAGHTLTVDRAAWLRERLERRL